MKPDDNDRNPWFKEFWEHHFHCSFVPEGNEKKCTGDEVISAENGQRVCFQREQVQERERERERERDRQTDRQTDRQREKKRERREESDVCECECVCVCDHNLSDKIKP